MVWYMGYDLDILYYTLNPEIEYNLRVEGGVSLTGSLFGRI